MNTPSDDAPRLTVAIPTYNGGRHLAETLRSILAQTEVPFDLIVCDDGSTDDTLAIVSREAGPRARVFRNETRLGLAGNWNACVSRSRTKWVAIVHQDDLLLPGHFARQMDLPDIFGLIASAAAVIDEHGQSLTSGQIEPGGLGPVNRDFPPGDLVPELSVSNPLRCSGVTIRTEVHAAVGGFDPSYRYVVDWDFWLRASQVHSVAWIAQPGVAFRWHLASETHTFKTGMSDLEETERLLAGLSRSPEEIKAADRRLARAYLNRAYEASRAGAGGLTRKALGRAFRLWPGIAGTVARDPRLLARLVLGSIRRSSSRSPSPLEGEGGRQAG